MAGETPSAVSPAAARQIFCPRCARPLVFRPGSSGVRAAPDGAQQRSCPECGTFEYLDLPGSDQTTPGAAR